MTAYSVDPTSNNIDMCCTIWKGTVYRMNKFEILGVYVTVEKYKSVIQTESHVIMKLGVNFVHEIVELLSASSVLEYVGRSGSKKPKSMKVEWSIFDWKGKGDKGGVLIAKEKGRLLR